MTYLLFIWKSHRGFALFSALIVIAVQSVVVNLVSSIDTAQILQVLLENLPERFRSFITSQFLTSLTLKGAVAFSWQHPIVLILLFINALNIPTQHIVGELESGTLELLLAHPITRFRLFVSLWAAGASLLLAVIVAGIGGSLVNLYLVGELELQIVRHLIMIALNLWFLILLVMSLTFLLATFAKQGQRIGAMSAGVFLLLYFLDLISVVWQRIDFFRPFNIFSYYQPQRLMLDQQDFSVNVAVLLSLTAACLLIGSKQFQRRDIPG